MFRIRNILISRQKDTFDQQVVTGGRYPEGTQKVTETYGQ